MTHFKQKFLQRSQQPETQQAITEARLQSECFTWFNNTYTIELGRLIMLHNNPRNAIQGSILKGMGLLPGHSDFLYFADQREVWFIEMKLPKTGTQSEEQKAFEKLCVMFGFKYFICITQVEFKALINSSKRLTEKSPLFVLRKNKS